jgi:hypothetical protein
MYITAYLYVYILMIDTAHHSLSLCILMIDAAQPCYTRNTHTCVHLNILGKKLYNKALVIKIIVHEGKNCHYIFITYV